MTAFSLSGLLAGISSLTFGILVLLKSTDRKLAHVWFLFSLSVAGWGFGGMWLGMQREPVMGLLVSRLTYAFGVLWIAPLLNHFVRIFINEDRSWAVSVNYLIGLFFFLSLPGHFFFTHTDVLFQQFTYPRGGILYPFFFVWWMSLVLLSHIRLVRALDVVSIFKKNQIQYFLLAIIVGFSGGSLCYLPNFGINIYPWGNFSVCLYPFIMTYAILKYNLMDIRIFIRRSGLLVGVYSGLLVIVLPLLFIFHKRAILGGQISLGILGFEVIFLSAILSSGPALYAYFVQRSSFFHEHTMAGLTHELKSPLTIIENAIEMIRMGIPNNGADPTQVAYVEMIERNTSRLKNYVNNLLQVYRVQNKKLSLEFKIIDVTAVCKRVVSERAELAQGKGIQLFFTETNGPIRVNCDDDKIEQVVSNLVSNAIKFTREGHVCVTAEGNEKGLKINVNDTGTGIPTKDLPYVFDRFFQGSMNKTSRGSGIGLAIAKAWVEAHGGKIWAESEGVGKGTKVTFTLPT